MAVEERSDDGKSEILLHKPKWFGMITAVFSFSRSLVCLLEAEGDSILSFPLLVCHSECFSQFRFSFLLIPFMYVFPTVY